jgi:UDP-N-acetylglucosamine--N-acetylmuramyl-(pentapeptide) pyrophosphoryl-undecaprenol N-acetylglucosamine transferase
MTVLIVGGGTAGHVTPLIAIAEEVKKRHPAAHIVYVGQRHDTSANLIKTTPAVSECFYIFSGKWRRYHGVGLWSHVIDIPTNLKNIRDIGLFFMGFCQCLGKMIIKRPIVVFSKGGYVSLPVGLAAALLHIPIVTHDSDAIPGLANRILARFASALAVGWPAENYTSYYPSSKIIYTGIPVRQNFYVGRQADQDHRHDLGVRSDGQIIAVLGGSLGSANLNEAVWQNLNKLLVQADRYLVWITGPNNYHQTSHKLQQSKLTSRVKLLDFTDDVAKIMAISTVIVSRAGATTIAEMAALGKPAILIPNPYLTGGHQLVNARVLQEHGAALVIQETELKCNPDILSNIVNNLISNKHQMASLGNRLHDFSVESSTAQIVNAIDKVIG